MKYKQQIEQFFAEHREQFIEHIRQLVQIRSVEAEKTDSYPFGEGPALALDKTLEIAQELGLITHNMDYYVGTIDISNDTTKLGILGHVDIVPEGSNWSYPPFEGVIEDGKMYGRGTSDDKGPVIAATYALAAVKKLNIPLQYNTRLIVGTDEESGCEDIDYYFAKQSPPPFLFTPDAEFPVINIEKGAIRTSFAGEFEASDALPRVIRIRGGHTINVVPPEAEADIEGLSLADIEKAAIAVSEATKIEFSFNTFDNQIVRIYAKGVGGHASLPEQANNALTGLLALVAALPLAESEGQQVLQGVASIFPHGDHQAEAAGLAMSDELSGALTMNLSIMDYDATNLVAYFDSRVPLCATVENTFDVLEKKLQPFGITLNRTGFEPPHHTPADSTFVQVLLKVYEEYTGLKGECIAIGGGTYVHGIPGGVAFGPTMPGIDTRMHSNDEFIIIDDMLKAAQIYAQTIVEICGVDSDL